MHGVVVITWAPISFIDLLTTLPLEVISLHRSFTDTRCMLLRTLTLIVSCKSLDYKRGWLLRVFEYR